MSAGGQNSAHVIERPPRNASGVCCSGVPTSHRQRPLGTRKPFGTHAHRASPSTVPRTVNSGPTARPRIYSRPPTRSAARSGCSSAPMIRVHGRRVTRCSARCQTLTESFFLAPDTPHGPSSPPRLDERYWMRCHLTPARGSRNEPRREIAHSASVIGSLRGH